MRYVIKKIRGSFGVWAYEDNWKEYEPIELFISHKQAVNFIDDIGGQVINL